MTNQTSKDHHGNPWDLLPPGNPEEDEPECRNVCRELNAHNAWKISDQFKMSAQALDWWRQRDERERLQREVQILTLALERIAYSEQDCSDKQAIILMREIAKMAIEND